MNPSLPRLLLLVAIVLVAPPAPAQALPLKTGTWEMTHKSAMMPRPMVEKECVTQADLAQLAGRPGDDDDGACRYVRPPVVAGKTWSADKLCANGLTTHAEFTAESPERVRGTVVSTPKGVQPMTIDIAGRWLAAGCAGVR